MMTPEQLAAIKASLESLRDPFGLNASTARVLVAEVERLRRVEAAAKAVIRDKDDTRYCALCRRGAWVDPMPGCDDWPQTHRDGCAALDVDAALREAESGE